MNPPAAHSLPASYAARRQEIETYFDRTAADAWARLTSTAPVSGIRATVRAGRDRMRATLLDWLPADLSGRRVLDAGCGTGALAVEAARRGAEVVAIDLSPTLVQLARDRLPADLGAGRVDFRAGDMLDASLGSFDHVVGMDSLIHYERHDAVRVLGGLAARTRGTILFTFAPGNAWLGAMIAVGRLFPRGDRAPSIVPVPEQALRGLIDAAPGLNGWSTGRSQRVSSGFYKSHALELVRGASAQEASGHRTAASAADTPAPVIPAQAGSQSFRLGSSDALDPRLRGDDGKVGLGAQSTRSSKARP